MTDVHDIPLWELAATLSCKLKSMLHILEEYRDCYCVHVETEDILRNANREEIEFYYMKICAK